MLKESLTSNNGQIMQGPCLLIPQVFKDDRGFFLESWNHKVFTNSVRENIFFVQDNHSKSSYRTLRGLHFQMMPMAQGKLIRCIHGEIYDVIVDIRKNSRTFGEWTGVRLDAKNFQQLWVPIGFAHGFLTLSKNAEIIYKVSEYWDQKYEKVLSWNDEDLSIKWPLNVEPKLSKKDSFGLSFQEIKEADFFNN